MRLKKKHVINYVLTLYILARPSSHFLLDSFIHYSSVTLNTVYQINP